ncbi:MAG TPA: major capsid protein, partial [Vicinamibacterales bacterium]|nr:major capsid protein [Vicinamibacterales bacterium]
MEFQIPEASSLPRFTVAALRDLGLEAAAAYETLFAAVNADRGAATDDQLDELEDLVTFMGQVDEEMTARTKKNARFANLPTPGAAKPAADKGGEDAEDGEDEEEEPAAVTASTDVAVPTISEIKPGTLTVEAIEGDIIDPEKAKFRIIAAPDTGFAAGSELQSWTQVAEAFQNRAASYRGANSVQQHGIALIERQFGEFDMGTVGSDEALYERYEKVRDERNTEGGSLTAGVGWCAPSETIYTTCSQVTIDGILSAPEVGARRGGIRHNTGIQFDSVFGTGTGFNILTEAQVISDTVKTCVAIPCPSFVDDRLKVAVLCLTGDILQNRGYPEFVSTFMQAAIATQAHNVNRQIIADIVAGSTAVSLAGEPFLSDGSVVSNIMSGVDLAIMDIQYRLRLRRDQNVEIVLPYWLKAQMRADWIRRNAVSDPDLADSAISAMFTSRNASVQWV